MVTAVKPNGQVEGTMEFDLQSFVSTFGDKPDSIKSINYGVISGSTLIIESALGGKYELTLDGNRLSGFYTRGNTYKVAGHFQQILTPRGDASSNSRTRRRLRRPIWPSCRPQRN